MKKLLPIILYFTCIHLFAQGTPQGKADSMFLAGKYGEAYLEYKNDGIRYQQTGQFHHYALTNLRMAVCKLKEGKADFASQLASRTLSYLKESLPQEAELMAECHLIAGEALLNLGRNDLALEMLKQAESYQEVFQDLKTAECYNLLGVAYWNNENKTTALFYHEKALSIREKLLPINDVAIADSYNNLGLIYLGSEDLKALIFFDKALKIYQNAFGKSHPKVANCLTNMAFANSFQRNFGEAMDYLDRVTDIWDTNFSGDHPNKAFTLSNKGRIKESQGNFNEAILFQQEALQMYVRLYGAKHPEISNTYFLIGKIRQQQSNFLEAAENFQASIYANLFNQDFQTLYDLPQLRDYYNADILLASLQAKAKALEALHFEKTLKFIDINGALSAYQLCDDLITVIRRIRLSEKDKLRLGLISSEVYENGIRISLYLSENTFKKRFFMEKAFSFCERSKSAVLLDAIQETKAKSFSGIPAELLSLEDSLKDQISFLERQLATASANQDQIKNQLFDFQKSYMAFISNLESGYPEYYQLKYNQNYATVEDVQAALTPGSAVLSYFTASTRVYIFVISKVDFQVVDLPKSADFQRLITSLRNGIKYDIRSAFEESASRLYSQLIPKLPSDIQHLILLPDGTLGTLPFEALISSQNPTVTYSQLDYLINRYSISYDYGATLLTERLKKTQKSTTNGILLAAPVSFEKNELKMSTLPDSETEIKQIKYLFNDSQNAPTLLVRQDANEAVLKSDQIGSYKYLHFATHGVVNESRPELSRIFLSPTAGQDGSLYNGEIYNLKINAALVTLSACETGLGKVARGEGIVGLSRSLLYAGAENLIVSLWQVADASTSELMIEFYRQHLHHSTNEQFHDDLRKAKLSMIRAETYAKPYYWAPFILVGQ